MFHGYIFVGRKGIVNLGVDVAVHQPDQLRGSDVMLFHQCPDQPGVLFGKADRTLDDIVLDQPELVEDIIGLQKPVQTFHSVRKDFFIEVPAAGNNSQNPGQVFLSDIFYIPAFQLGNIGIALADPVSQFLGRDFVLRPQGFDQKGKFRCYIKFHVSSLNAVMPSMAAVHIFSILYKNIL